MEYKQFCAALAVITDDQGRILMGTRNQPDIPDIHNKLEFPGGGIEMEETPEQAVVREAKEETGLDVKIVRMLPKVYANLWNRNNRHERVFLLAYECKIIGGEIRTDDPEIAKLEFMKPEDIEAEKCLPKTKEIIELLKF